MKTWIRRNWFLLPVAGLAVIFLLKGLKINIPSEIKMENFAKWDWATTLLGKIMEDHVAVGSSVWLWVIVPVAVLLIGLIIRKMFKTKKAVPRRGGGFAKGVESIFDAFTGSIAAVVLGAASLTVIALLILALMLILHAFGIVDKNGLPFFLQ